MKRQTVSLFFLLFGVLSISFFSSCLTAKKMDKFISEQYGESITLKKTKSDYFEIKSPLITGDAVPSVSEKKNHKTLPLLFYWEYGYKTSSTLNPMIPINQFTTAFTTFANSKNLKQLLNGGKLELNITQVPRTFSFNVDAHTIFLIVAHISWDKIYLLPEHHQMEIAYKVIKDGVETKKGTITVADPNETRQPRYFQSSKSATKEYLAIFDQNIRTMAKLAVDKLNTELQ